MKRSRGRGGRRPPNNNSGGGGGGPEIKIRGSASHVYEKYLQLARDSNASGDRVMAENYLQHAEHYYRILAANQLQQQQYQAQQAHYQANGNGGQRPQVNGNVDGNGTQPYAAVGPSFSLSEDEDDGENAQEN
jgi:hypothetical protein